jgi:hypothetical protein
MLAREAASGSLGSQTSLGSALAKQMTCSPVPDPISSTLPLPRKTRVSTSRIGPELRAAKGENCRASLTPLRSSATTGGEGWSEFDIIIGTRGSVSYGETEAPLARTSCKTLNPSNSG